MYMYMVYKVCNSDKYNKTMVKDVTGLQLRTSNIVRSKLTNPICPHPYIIPMTMFTDKPDCTTCETI